MWSAAIMRRQAISPFSKGDNNGTKCLLSPGLVYLLSKTVEKPVGQRRLFLTRFHISRAVTGDTIKFLSRKERRERKENDCEALALSEGLAKKKLRHLFRNFHPQRFLPRASLEARPSELAARWVFKISRKVREVRKVLKRAKLPSPKKLCGL